MGRWASACWRLGQGQRALVLSPPVHVRVRLCLGEWASQQQRRPVGAAFVCAWGGRGGSGGRHRGLGTGLQGNVLHGAQVLQVQLFRVWWLVLFAVEEAHLLEIGLQIVFDATDDLQEGGTHLRVILPAHAHQLKPKDTHTACKMIMTIPIFSTQPPNDSIKDTKQLQDVIGPSTTLVNLHGILDGLSCRYFTEKFFLAETVFQPVSWLNCKFDIVSTHFFKMR